MNHLVLIDSSVWIGILRGRPRQDLAEQVRSLIARAVAATNNLIKLEIMAGAGDERRFHAYGETLRGIATLPIEDSTWNGAAELGFRLRRRGITVHSPDLIIAASAIEHDAVLLHADADFDRIAAGSSLRVESYA